MSDTPTLIDQPTSSPSRKVGAATSGSGLTLAIVAILGAFGIEIPAEAAVGIGTILTFIGGYFVKERA